MAYIPAGAETAPAPLHRTLSWARRHKLASALIVLGGAYVFDPRLVTMLFALTLFVAGAIVTLAIVFGLRLLLRPLGSLSLLDVIIAERLWRRWRGNKPEATVTNFRRW